MTIQTHKMHSKIIFTFKYTHNLTKNIQKKHKIINKKRIEKHIILKKKYKIVETKLRKIYEKKKLNNNNQKFFLVKEKKILKNHY